MRDRSDDAPAALSHTEEKQWAMFIHLGGLASLLSVGIPLGSIVVPLILWMIKKGESELVEATGREVLNFQISILLYFIGAGILCFVLIGFVLLPAVVLLQLVASIIGAVKASSGESFRYPLTIRFL